MTIYHPEIVVVTSLHAFSDKANVSTKSYKIEVDAPSFDGLLSDLEHICKEIVAAHIQRFIDENIELLPLHVDVGYSVMSLEKSFTHTIKKNEFDSLRKSTAVHSVMLNPESLQNDIQYGITMLRSIVDIEKDVAMHGVVSWYYHLLLKHFGLPIPKEIIDIHEANMKKLHDRENPK